MDIDYNQSNLEVNNQGDWSRYNLSCNLMPMNALADRINERMEELGLTQEMLARRSRVSQAAIHKICSGKTKQTRKLVQIAAVLGVNPYWLETGLGEKLASNQPTLKAAQVAYPLISWVQAGAWSEIINLYPFGSSDTMVYANGQHGPYSFGLQIYGNSMLPQFEPGDIIIIDPEIQPRPGDYVVAKNQHEEATFKKYRPRGTDADGKPIFELVPLNDDYATLRSDHDPITIIGVQVEHTRIRRK